MPNTLFNWVSFHYTINFPEIKIIPDSNNFLFIVSFTLEIYMVNLITDTYKNCNKNVSDIRLHPMVPVGYCLDDSIVCHGIDVTDTKNISIVRGVEFIDIKAVPVNDSLISFDICITSSLQDLSGFHQVSNLKMCTTIKQL